MTEIERLQMNANQVNSDFVAIKGRIIEKGIEVADGTRTAEYASKIDEVYEAGRKSQYDEFWDAFQDNGNRLDYSYAFYSICWNDSNFKPKYDLKPTLAAYLMGSAQITNLKQILEDCGVTLDTSLSTNNIRMFRYAPYITHIPTISAENSVSNQEVFYGCSGLVTIDKFILKQDGTSPFNDTFYGCRSLVNLTIEGTIGGSGFNLQWSKKLSYSSITSIINALSTTTSGLSITLSLEAVDNAFAEEDEYGNINVGTNTENWHAWISTRPNWTINLV